MLKNLKFYAVIKKYYLLKRHSFSTVCQPNVILSGKNLVKLTGVDTMNFLQGLLSIDITQFKNPTTNILYTYLLNPQGRLLYDVFVFKVMDHESVNFYLECDDLISEELVNHLKKHLIRKKVAINLEKDLQVGVIFPIPGIFANKKVEEIPSYPLFKDPRYDNIGIRCLLPNKITKTLNNNDDTYIKHRYMLGIGEGVVDHPPGKSLPLECNGDLLNAISFTKGCYVGQELTSRTYNMGVVRKRLLPITFTDPNIDPKLVIPQGTDIVTENGLKCGTYRNRSGRYGLALMRLKESLGKDLLLYVDGKQYLLTTRIPDWMKINIT